MFGWLKRLGSWLSKAVKVVETKISDEQIAKAVSLVKHVREIVVDNDARREFVVVSLIKSGMKESLARLAVELAVQLVKDGE